VVVVQEAEGPTNWGAHVSLDHANRVSLNEAPCPQNNGCDLIHVLLNGLLWIKLEAQKRLIHAQKPSVVFNNTVIYI